MCEPTVTHEVVCLNGGVDVFFVNANGHTHEHVLWTLCNAAVYAQQVAALKGFETKEVIPKVAVVNDG